ncbi:MAG TPA: HPr(Ser) kinase/phosphatase [Candidatus Polarisedimenticolia bacterium]|jgi:HPr kinase/phosphorylase|nr:HPr(Ser) kinase/phosphatase [Candidatus Polarisedimenticolia bacterium]
MQDLPRLAIPVRELLSEELSEIRLVLAAGGAGLERSLTHPRIQKAGLALTGPLHKLQRGRVQVLGSSEIDFMEQLGETERAALVRRLFDADLTCFILTRGLAFSPLFLKLSEERAIPLLRTELPTAPVVEALGHFLEERLAPCQVLHGVLMDIYGLGVLLLGDSGVGKSESALDLVVRGHRLVTDDVVEIVRKGNVLTGTGPAMTRFHMELRGLGIINIKDLFGVAAVREKKDIELIVRLELRETGKSYERLGLDEQVFSILGLSLPYIEMPVTPGKNLSVLLEVAARNQLLKRRGYHPAKELARRLGEAIQRRRP